MSAFAAEHLTTLLAVLDEGTLEGAAARLHLTPSAVSQRVRALEGAAGSVLLRRSTPVALTAAGERVARHARRVALLEEDLRAELAADAASTRPVAVATNADSLGTWFVDAAALAAERGGVVVDVHRADDERTIDLLRAGAVVAAVTAAAGPVQGCHATPIGTLRYRAVATPGFAERWAPPDAASRLAEAPAVEYDRDDGMLRRSGALLAGRAPTGPRHRVPDAHGITAAILAGMGWGLVPDPLADTALADGRLVDLAAGRAVRVALLWQRWTVASAALDALTAAVLEVRRGA